MESQNQETSETGLKERTARGLFWSVFGNGAQQVVTMLVGIALARILRVEDYGLVALLTVFSIIAGNLQESGFTSALAVRREADERHFNAVFWFSVGISALLYVLLFFAAPSIARFNHAPELTLLARVVFLGFFISSFGTAHAAWLFRHLMVREKTSSQVSASLLSGIVGLSAALAGWGCWALVAMDLTYKLTYTTMIWHYCPWRPALQLNLRPAFGMLGFGSRILLTNILNTLNNQLLQSVLGHFFPILQVGYYSQANKWTLLSSGLLTGMTSSVAQPVLATVGDDAGRQTRVFRKMLRFSAFISFPAMFGLALIAPEFIPLTIGEKWMPCVPYLMVLCAGGAFVMVNGVFTHLMISCGRSGMSLCSTAFFLLSQGALILAFAAFGNMLPLLAGIAILQPVWMLIFAMLCRRLVQVNLSSVVADIAPFLLAAALMAGISGWACHAVFVSPFFHDALGRIPVLLAKVLLSVAIYWAIMQAFRPDVYTEGILFVREKLRRRK